MDRGLLDLDLLSSLAITKVKDKVGGSGLIEECLRKLKFKVPEPGVRAILIPTAENLENCRQVGRRITCNL